MLHALPLLALLALVPQQDQMTVTVNGVAPQGLGVTNLDFYLAPTLPPCGTYHLDQVPPFDCRGTYVDGFGQDAVQLAATMALVVNNACSGSGFSAQVSGNTVTIVGPAGFDLGISGNEFSGCGGLKLRGCTINNLSNGFPCDQTAPFTGGVQMIGSAGGPVASVPAVGPLALSALVVVLVATGLALART